MKIYETTNSGSYHVDNETHLPFHLIIINNFEKYYNISK